MTHSTALALLLILAVPASAKTQKKKKAAAPAPPATNEVRFKKHVDPGALQKDLVDAGFGVNYIDCTQDDCAIHLLPNEHKNPMPIVDKYVYVDPLASRKQKIEQMKALQAKWEAGTITPEEKDTLLKMLTAFVLGS